MKKDFFTIATLLGITSTSLMAQEIKPHSEQNHGKQKPSMEIMARNFESAERDSYQLPDKVVEYLGDLKHKKIVDIGSGTGYFSVRLANKGAIVIAADVNDDFQNYLKRRIEDNNIANIELRKVQYDTPNLKDAEVDMAFVANTYHHIDNRAEYFSKVKKGLKTNGKLVIIDYFSVDIPKEIQSPPMAMRVSVDQVVHELKKAGFTFFKVEVSLLPYQYIITAG